MMKGFHVERSRHDIKYFYEWLSEEYQWANHIEEWMELYKRPEKKSVNRVCIIAPRSHSKSSTLRVKLLHMCLFEKDRGKPMTIWLFSASNRQAFNRLAEIEEDMRRHPELRKLIKKSTKDKIAFTNGSWIRAAGVGAAIRGEHPGCVALDDVLAELGDMTMDKVIEWFRKVVTPMNDPGTSLFVVGTPMALTDLYHSEMLSEKAKEVWSSGTWSAFPNWDEHRADPDNIELEPLWPEFRPTDFLIEQKLSMNDDLAFAQEYLCKVVDDDSQVFKRGDVRKNIDVSATLGLDMEFDDSRYVIGFDPSHGIGKDYTVLIVLRQDAEGVVHFVNMWRRNDFPPDRQADVIIEWSHRYGKAPIAAEDVGFQRLYEALIVQKGGHLDYRASKASNKGLKQGLLNRLRTWFEQGKFQWPYGNIETRNMVNIILDELENHIWKNGDIVDVGKHNDTVMALAHALDQFNKFDVTKTPVVTGTAQVKSWQSKGKPKKPSQHTGKYVSMW